MVDTYAIISANRDNCLFCPILYVYEYSMITTPKINVVIETKLFLYIIGIIMFNYN